MAEPSGGDDEALPMLTPEKDPAQYTRQSAKERFAVAKFYGMGSDGEWTVADIADALDVGERQVYRYLNESDIGQEVREVLATTEAEWRLDMALQLRREVEDINQALRELKDRKTAVPTAYETKTVEGTPTGDHNVRLDDDTTSYKLKMPVPTDFETVTDYGPDVEKLQKEKRQYLEQIADLLGLNDSSQGDVDQTLATRHEEVKIVEFREADDDYPETEVVDMAEASDTDLNRDTDEPVDTVDIDDVAEEPNDGE